MTVEHNGLYYACQIFAGKVKCGKCLFGLINPFAIKGYGDKCLRCGAELAETVTGIGLDAESYRP